MAEEDRTFRTSTKPTEPESGAAGTGRKTGPRRRDAWGLDPNQGRDDADIDDAGDLGAGTPAGVDVHKLGEQDDPEADWGDEGDEGLMHSANHSRRGVKSEAERGQGRRTRQLNKDIVIRRT